jgi:hypothetical protein
MPLDYWPEMALQRDTLQVDFNGNHFKGYMVAPADGAGPKPMVIVIHNYQGLNILRESVMSVSRSIYMVRLFRKMSAFFPAILNLFLVFKKSASKAWWPWITIIRLSVI